MKRRHWFWLAATIIFSIFLSVIFSGPSGTLDINIYDTYFVIANEFFWFWTVIIVFCCSYLIQCLANGFSTKSSNIILLISLAIGMVIMIPIAQFLFMTSGYDVTLKDTPTADFWKKVYYGFKVFYGVCVIVFGFSAFKTGQNWKT